MKKHNRNAAMQGLAFFPLDANFMNDYKLQEVYEFFGPQGIVVYIYTLCMVYKQGFYLEMNEHDLAYTLSRQIGEKWMPYEDVCEILQFLTTVGLLDRESYKKGIITSHGIQRRHCYIFQKLQGDISKYWLLSDE